MSSNSRRRQGRGSLSGYDKGLSVLESYGFVSKNTYRGRGALICQTQEGFKLIKPFEGSVRRLKMQNQLLNQLKEAGFPYVDRVCENAEGELVTTDKEGISYVVKDWYEARECDTGSREDVLAAVKRLADYHKAMRLTPEPEDQRESLYEELQRHSRQMKKMRMFIRTRKAKTPFEYCYLNSVDRYMNYGEQALAHLELQRYEADRQADFQAGKVVHGAYNQHNVMFLGQNVFGVNFDHWCFDHLSLDLANFMRKILEKHNWNQSLGLQMIKAYDNASGLSSSDLKQLVIRLAYPEKYWKLANYYYNTNKAFLSDRHREKLEILLGQETNWQIFVKTCFSNFLF